MIYAVIILRCRPTVGHLTLDQIIGVRIPAPQPYKADCGADRSTLLEDKRVLFFCLFGLLKLTDLIVSVKSTAEFMVVSFFLSG